MSEIQPTSFAVMRFQDIHLMLPQVETVGIDLVGAIQPPVDDCPHSIGTIEHQGQSLPVFSLTRTLTLTRNLVEGHKFCVFFSVDQEPTFSLTCETVEPQQFDVAQIHPMPDPMSYGSNPVQNLVVWNDQLMFASDARSIQSYLSDAGGQGE